jgi:hypothetical protein
MQELGGDLNGAGRAFGKLQANLMLMSALRQKRTFKLSRLAMRRNGKS